MGTNGHGVFSDTGPTGQQHRLDSALTPNAASGASPYLSESAWRSLLRKHQIKPNRKLGQNFLFARGPLKQIVKAAELDRADSVVEIGAGIGSLTRVLASTAGSVGAIELDRRLLPALVEATADFENVQIEVGDALQVNLPSLASRSDYVVTANIPYNITSAVLRRMVESDPPPVRAILTVQRELAERVVAPTGQLSLLSLSVQLYGAPEIVTEIKASAFWPVPKVDSAVLKIHGLGRQGPDPRLAAAVFDLARAAFSQRRKQVHNSLAAGLGLPTNAVDEVLATARIDRSIRPQSISIERWLELGEAYLEWRQANAGTTESAAGEGPGT